MPSVSLAAVANSDGVTELRVHGVGGTSAGAILGDLAPEQASGDQTAGFYRSDDHHADPRDLSAGQDVDRHVEVYSWGGLTSQSNIRVLWLALLPFLLGNLAGWMCSASTRASRWRFGLHRLSFGLSSLALTVNATLLTVMVTANLLAYQAARAGLAGHQWWLAPLGWHFIAGHPARQVLIGVLVPVLLLLALTWLATRTWKYERVRPPYRQDQSPQRASRKVTAAVLDGGLADDEFWDGEGSVSILTWLHVAVAVGFLAVVLGVTARAITGSSRDVVWQWIALGLGAVTVAIAVAYICLDALATLSDTLRGWMPFLLVPAALALVSSGVFAWLQPGAPAQPGGSAAPAGLPGMAGVIGWTTLAIAVPVALALISALLGISRRSAGTMIGGSWVTLMLGFILLNLVLLGAGIWLAHLVGPVTNDAALAGAKIYLPLLITSGVPLVAWAMVAAALVFAAIELLRWWRARQLPPVMRREYQDQAQAFRINQPPELMPWYWSGLPPFAPPGEEPGPDGQSQGWEQEVARTQLLAKVPHDATWLLWGVVVVQVLTAWSAWQFHWQPPVVVRDVGVALAGLVLPALMGYLYSAWSDPGKRRVIGVLWDVGTFWPRSYHPLAPPCYSERAVPELQRRMWWLHDNGGSTLLVAHSQGAVLATAALVQPGCRATGDHPALITFGSPVHNLYTWGFPAYVTAELLTPLAPGGEARLRDWRNLYYPTDPVGGPVAADLPPADGRLVDTKFLDPAACWYVYGQAPPSPQGHSGYWADPRVWTLINRVAAELSPIQASATVGVGD